tara:strand:+ start:1155 stop:1343 length:189 start_codon:yes stop_codon:yes gene_type:complete
MTTKTITIPKREYNSLKKKATLFEHYVESESLSEEELTHIKKSLKGPFLSKSEFLRRHPHLE